MNQIVNKHNFTEREIDRIIEMAWEDRTTFEAIEYQFKITEAQVIEIMRLQLKPGSFRLWRKRVQGRKTKHQKLRKNEVGRFKSSRQRSISNNKMSKR
ncbi:TIGR03643 family protein [Gillisia sp. Q332]|uniref:TIGR03643 family protein n=1 Tax=Gillisia xinjiangensis TaxID=3384765 RepID=UPI003919098E